MSHGKGRPRAQSLILLGVAILFFILLGIGNDSRHASAATWLGIQQGIKSYNPNSPYTLVTTPGTPAPLVCWIPGSWDYKNTWGYPNCPYISTNLYPIAVFSGHLTASTTGESVYLTYNEATGNKVVPTLDMGPAESIATCPSGFNSKGTCMKGYVYTYDCNNYTTPAGYDHIELNGTECWAYKFIPAAQATATTTLGTAPTIPVGKQFTLEWSCLSGEDYIYANQPSGSGGAVGVYDGGTTYFLEKGVVGYSGPGFAPPVGQLGSVTINTPTVGSYVYSLTCSGANTWSPTMYMPLTVVAAPLQPTLTISAGAGNGVGVNVPVGTPVTLTATFTSASGDWLTQTAIDGPNSTNCASGGDCSSASTSKSVSFIPSAAGTYTFYPSTLTWYYSSWNNYNASVTVTASMDVCTDIAGQQPSPPPGCQAPSPSPGQCIPTNYTYSGGSCSCPLFGVDGLTCVASCPANSTASGGKCTCNSGYNASGNTCSLAGSITGRLQATPLRIPVAPNNKTVLTWSTSNMTSCTLKDETGATISSQTSSAGTAIANITHTKTFILSCGDGVNTYTNTVTVTLVPTVKEI